MNEQEWLDSTDPMAMLEFLRHKASERKLRLFGCACCRHVWPMFRGQTRDCNAVIVAERYADGLATLAQLKFARKRTSSCERRTTTVDAFDAAYDASFDASHAVRYLTYAPDEGWRLVHNEDGRYVDSGYTDAANRLVAQQKQGQAKLLRDIFGNPFRLSVLHPDCIAWGDSTVSKVARSIYDAHAFEQLPILADALEEAGCTEQAILDHCRGPGPHVRGCWVIDLILGRQ